MGISIRTSAGVGGGGVDGRVTGGEWTIVDLCDIEEDGIAGKSRTEKGCSTVCTCAGDCDDRDGD